jgi:hypothetical protein
MPDHAMRLRRTLSGMTTIQKPLLLASPPEL